MRDGQKYIWDVRSPLLTRFYQVCISILNSDLTQREWKSSSIKKERVNILFVTSYHQTTKLVFPNFFHEFFSVWTDEKEIITNICKKLLFKSRSVLRAAVRFLSLLYHKKMQAYVLWPLEKKSWVYIRAAAVKCAATVFGIRDWWNYLMNMLFMVKKVILDNYG